MPFEDIFVIHSYRNFYSLTEFLYRLRVLISSTSEDQFWASCHVLKTLHRTSSSLRTPQIDPPALLPSPSESPLSTGRWGCYTASSEGGWPPLLSSQESLPLQARRRHCRPTGGRLPAPTEVSDGGGGVKRSYQYITIMFYNQTSVFSWKNIFSTIFRPDINVWMFLLFHK